MSEIVKISEVKTVPFEKQFKGMTYGQQVLLKMLTTHLKEQRPITKQDIEDCYCEAVAPNGIKKYRDYEWVGDKIHYFVKEVELKTNWRKAWYSVNWFRTNLGACILKGKLLAIPVIELEETSTQIENLTPISEPK